jgi:hypothetical protein
LSVVYPLGRIWLGESRPDYCTLRENAEHYAHQREAEMGGKVIMQIDKVTPQMKCAVFLAGQRYRGTKQGRGNETGTRERNRDAGTKQGRGNEPGTRTVALSYASPAETPPLVRRPTVLIGGREWRVSAVLVELHCDGISVIGGVRRPPEVVNPTYPLKIVRPRARLIWVKVLAFAPAFCRRRVWPWPDDPRSEWFF